MTRVVVAGSVNLDLVYAVDRFPAPGETVLGSALTRLSGGKGANQAHAAARVAADGVRAAFVGCVGDDEAADRLRGDLAAAGVDVSGVVGVPGASGTALIAVDADGENEIVVVPGANRAWPAALVDELAIDAGDVVATQLEIPLPMVAALLRRARAAGARTALNASPVADGVANLLPDVDVLVVNEGEALALAGVDQLDTAVARLGAAERDVVVTLGAAGALVAPRGGDPVAVPAYRVDAIDTVGAGDAFAGALAAELAAGADLVAAVRMGSAAGALTATVRGARHHGLTRTAALDLLG